MNPKKNQYLNLKPQGSSKYQHRRIHTELEDPSANKYTREWLETRKEPRAIESMRFIPTSAAYHPSKYENKAGVK